VLTVYFATTNSGKIRSAQRRFEPLGIKICKASLELEEKQDNDFEVIASQKADDAYRQLQKPVMVIDAGLSIDALNGFPGPYSKYVFETLKIEGILRAMIEFKEEEGQRKAYFTHVLAFQDGTRQQPKIFTGIVSGKIATEIRGSNMTYGWSDAVRIFIPNGWDKTQGEMSDEQQFEFRQQTGTYYTEFANWYKQDVEDIHGRHSAALLTI
jgi:XTP/dITP diphosphohydrolase